MSRWGLRLLVAGGLAVSAAVAMAQSAEKAATPAPEKTSAQFDTAVFAEIPSFEGPELSPNGKAIAAKVAVNGTQYFAIIPLDGGKARLVGLGDADLNWWSWVNDEWLVIGIGQLVPYEGDDIYVSRALGVNATSVKLTKLSSRDAAQDADDVIWTASDGTPRILMASQTSLYTSEPGFWPQVDEIDVSTGRHKTVVRGNEGIFNWYADGSGAVRMGYGMSLDGRTRRVVYRDSAKGSFRTIDRARTHKEALTVPAMFLKEPGRAVMIADDEQGYSALWELDLETLARGKQLFATKGYDIGGLVRDASGFNYLGVYVNEDKPGIRWTDPALEAMHKTVAAKIKGGEPRIVSLSRDRSAAIVHVGGVNAPGAYFLYRAADDSMQFLKMNNSTIGLKRMHPVRTIRYKARDGLEIAAVLTLPFGKKNKLPLIVMPHGGPFARDTEEWDWWAQFLAERGYAVVQPNYRGSSGYGTPFTEKGQGQWGLAMQDDLNDVVTELAKLGIADPRRVCMVGASYGGYAAMRAAQRDGKLYRCAVAYAGVSDLNRMIGHDRNFLGAGARKDWLKMQAPDLKSVSPVHHAEEFSIPLLLVHGKKDRVVPPVHSRVMAQKLKAAGKDVTWIEQPEADHHFSRSEDRLEFLKALEAFLAKHNPA
ncbi:alpha/beta hydrolase family protein [Sphingomonas psychrotolerans]|uniref:S9 family peptidase n=1 Tax=Sphingomonas psychrotolerans TaxID=1327635 RepID=A0A2K8MHE5_9SPHN|nr:alpha/beta fold hydrolase [Sphingomonas psychrotolerans]ATY30591.1 S9 family peptidase [Sphingomonas psychrotolerans]